jgi:hypothetical protein
MRLPTSYSEGTAADFLVRMPAYSGRWWVGFQVAGTFADNNPWVLWIARNTSTPAQIWPEFTVNGMPDVYEAARMNLDLGAAHLFGIDRAPRRVLFRSDDVVRDSFDAGTSLPGALNVRVTNESANPLYIGMVRVRATTFPYPTVTRGPTQP